MSKEIQILILFSIVGILSLFSAGMAVICVKMTRMHKRIRQMVEDAINGDFEEKTYDESVASSLETKLHDWIGQAVLSEQDFKCERQIIQSTIADISHQTKTPITNLSIYTELLLEQPLDAETKEYLKMVQFQTEKLSFLIQALVKASRLETGVIALQPEILEIGTLLKQVSSQAAKIAEDKKRILSCDFEEGTAAYDLKWTFEALMNMVDNAVKYSGEGTKIQITGYQYEMFYRIDVKDQGIGIAEEEQAKIFTRFYRASEVSQKEGVGLGLYLAREIITMEAGYIKVSSTVGEGSTFSVFLKR